MSVRLFVPRDAGALAVGADEVAHALHSAALERGVEIEIVRNGSRGLYWLEPLVELATAQGRLGFGPVTADDVPSLLDSIISDKPHRLSLGPTEESPCRTHQPRLTFARCGVVAPLSLDDYRAHGGYKG